MDVAIPFSNEENCRTFIHQYDLEDCELIHERGSVAVRADKSQVEGLGFLCLPVDVWSEMAEQYG